MYEWVVWFHIISVISWFAMLFYLPRLFVYHAEQADNGAFVAVVEVMEQKLFRYIGWPAMVATLLSGTALAILYPVNIFTTGGWFHAKLLFVALLVWYFFLCGHYMTQLKNSPHVKSGKFFRFFNEIPTLLMVFIVAFVVVKPF